MQALHACGGPIRVALKNIYIQTVVHNFFSTQYSVAQDSLGLGAFQFYLALICKNFQIFLFEKLPDHRLKVVRPIIIFIYIAVL